MPELPDLEVIREFLSPRLQGVEIVSAEVRRPIVVRNLAGGDVAQQVLGRRFAGVERRGKFLILRLDDGLLLVVNPMLAGRLRYMIPRGARDGEPLARPRARDVLVLGLSDGRELRYHDAVDMGKVYITHDLDQVPGYAGQGPEANAPELTLDVFRERLRRHPGEIKGTLTNQAFVAGIGNAYADEILWAARIYPFRRRPSLAVEEVARLHSAMQEVLGQAIVALRGRVGEAIDVEVRDFLAVHGKPGQPCPRCGTAISEVKRAGIATHFCRTCQPGLMLAR